jgi:tripartite ATP-independent transporter DctP family solute receptor
MIILAIILTVTRFASAADEKFVIKLGHVEPNESNEHKGSEKFKELLEDRSNKRIIVELFPNSQLGNENDLVESVKMNSIQMTIPSAGSAARFYAPFNIFMTPFYLPGNTELEKYNNLMAVIDCVYPELREGLIKASGMRALAPFWYGDRCITNNKKEIKTPADLVGLNIRVPDQSIYVETFKAMGATPVPLSFGELYMALAQNVVDGQDNPANTNYVRKFYEVQKYLTVTGHTSQIQIPVINEKFFQKLPKDLQELVVQCMKEAAEYQSIKQAKDNAKIVAELVKLGMILSEPDRDAFIEATKNIPNIMLDAEGLRLLGKLRAELAKSR